MARSWCNRFGKIGALTTVSVATAMATKVGNDRLTVSSAAPACRMGKITLPKAGTYRIVLNPFNSATGSYRIPTHLCVELSGRTASSTRPTR